MIFGGVSRHLLLKSLPALKLAVTAELKVAVAVTDVRFGSLADIPQCNVCFTPESGHRCEISYSALCPKADILLRNQKALRSPRRRAQGVHQVCLGVTNGTSAMRKVRMCQDTTPPR